LEVLFKFSSVALLFMAFIGFSLAKKKTFAAMAPINWVVPNGIA
jgi:hypothetical protein